MINIIPKPVAKLRPELMWLRRYHKILYKQEYLGYLLWKHSETFYEIGTF